MKAITLAFFVSFVFLIPGIAQEPKTAYKNLVMEDGGITANFPDYIGAFYNIVLENLNRNTLKPEDWQRTISINTLQFSPKIKKLSAVQKEQLLQSGQRAVQDFLNRKP